MRKHKFLVFTIMSSLLLSNCTADTDNSMSNLPKEVSHPTEENVPLSSQMINPQMVESEYFKKNLDPARLAYTVGKDGLNIETKDLFAEIAQIKKYKDYLLVLDSKQFQLKLYDFSGNMVAYRNIGGRGPGEAGLPRGLEIVNDLIYVLDEYYKIEVYVYENSNIDHVATHQLDYIPKYMCRLDDQMIIMGLRYGEENEEKANPKIIHIHDITNFERINSIVQPYQSDNPLITQLLTDGPIECNTTNSTIYFSYNNFPYVFNYALNGELIKSFDLSEYFETGLIIEINENGRPSSMQSKSNENNFFQTNHRFLFDDQNNLILNTNLSHVASGESRLYNYIYKIDLQSNTIELDKSFLYETVQIQLSDDLTVTSSSYPFPKFNVYKETFAND